MTDVTVPRVDAPGSPSTTARLLAGAAARIDAPDVVLALSRDGVRTVHTGGSAEPGPVPRERLHHELGSASKPYAGLLLARLVAQGRVRYEDRAADLLAPGLPVHPAVRRITLRQLLTHTSGLPGLPADFYPQAVPRWSTDPYGNYPADRVVRAFLRARPRHRPGTRWRYSNFAVSVLGHTLAAATGTPWEVLLHQQVLAPLGLGATLLRPGPDGTDATGHRRDGTPLPALDTGGFTAAGALRATPLDLLTFLEAHLGAAGPQDPSMTAALTEVVRPLLRRGWRHAHTHTLTWFHHPSPYGPVLFHAGATLGQQAFLGFRPGTGLAVAATATRRVHRKDTFVATAYELLTETP
ncbi:serine hydrolase domain-containing protein [Streptomyces bacillaris]|uniref:Beta-lactamase family protein n=1 Tax=Streptomyces cavourensis TaxID=67258 RepID=A0ABY5FFD1_9ACTN|nr:MULTISPECIES: serine hydrolase domain-containing protein [Streptomyces]NUW20204.1 beta-lactamase family protein [Streptomyces roseoviolaceus]NUV79628.1 beta-lactamase family protein [Streptomyces sp. CAI-155]NUV87864.1 beta-lactamase family protein [Streptomyces sp. KAI-26]UTR82458.1 beta-lactamase family protein [Streptomyces cavourensis]WAE66614.1 serine hydrolase [Streptomyces cavourensis]